MRIATGPSGSPGAAGTRASAAACTISRTCFSAMVPGLMRTPAAPASIAARARRQSKWMSAMIGTSASRTTRANAGASSAVGRLTRTSSQPAASSACTCASVASASPVRVHVMDCTATGAPPPTGTAPTMMRRGLDTTVSGRRTGPAGEPGPRLGETGGEADLRLPAEHPA